MLPTHIPTSCLPRILMDFAVLIEKKCEPGTDPLMWLGGCNPEEEIGYLPFLPYELEEDRETELIGHEKERDPIKRLDNGEELAIPLHTDFIGEEMTLIDGQPYRPLGGLGDEDDEYYAFWGGFYALGVKRDGDRLRIRPVGMNLCSEAGRVFYRSRIAEFPASFMARIEKYIALLT